MKKISEVERKLIRKLVSLGYSPLKIAILVGCSLSTVYRIYNEAIPLFVPIRMTPLFVKA